MAFALPRIDTASARYPWYVLGSVCVGMVMGTFDFGALNAAYPTLAAAFDAPAAVISWVGIAYSLTSASLLAVFGRLADLVGRKRVYLLGFVVYLVGAVAASLAPGLSWLIAARALCGVGSAMLVANSIAIIGAHVPAHRRGMAIGAVETAVAVGLALGPVAGGMLAERLGWRAIFLGSWPAGLLGLLVGLIVLRETPRSGPRERFDFLGAGLFATGVVALLLGLTLGSTTGWTTPRVLAAFLAAALLLPTFVVVERRVKHPMIALSLFRHPVFAAANVAKVCCYASFMSATFLAPFYLQEVLGLAPGQVGVALAPVPIALSVSALGMGALSDRVGTRRLCVAGLLLGAIGAVLLARLAPEGGYAAAFVSLLVLVFGMGTFIAPNDSAIIGAAPRHQLGVASGILALTRSLGMILGLAIAGTVFSARQAYYLASGAGSAAAFLAAFHDVFKVVLGLCLLGVALSLVGGPRRAAGPAHAHE
ncbi:MAG: MFS transporter [Chloroflexi bacterium]|nr:MFS transporter [Chloroflexota bacterium]